MYLDKELECTVTFNLRCILKFEDDQFSVTKELTKDCGLNMWILSLR